MSLALIHPLPRTVLIEYFKYQRVKSKQFNLATVVDYHAWITLKLGTCKGCLIFFSSYFHVLVIKLQGPLELVSKGQKKT